MILVHNDLTKDPTSRNFVHIEVHTQLHSATLVLNKLINFAREMANHLLSFCFIVRMLFGDSAQGFCPAEFRTFCQRRAVLARRPLAGNSFMVIL